MEINNNYYYNKYNKYKNKYLQLKQLQQIGGSSFDGKPEESSVGKPKENILTKFYGKKKFIVSYINKLDDNAFYSKSNPKHVVASISAPVIASISAPGIETAHGTGPETGIETAHGTATISATASETASKTAPAPAPASGSGSGTASGTALEIVHKLASKPAPAPALEIVHKLASKPAPASGSGTASGTKPISSSTVFSPKESLINKNIISEIKEIINDISSLKDFWMLQSDERPKQVATTEKIGKAFTKLNELINMHYGYTKNYKKFNTGNFIDSSGRNKVITNLNELIEDIEYELSMGLK